MPLTFDFPLIAINVFEDYFPLIASNLLVILFFLFFQNNRKKTDIAYRNQIALLEGRSLRSQMNPHFIYNALNSLQSIMILKGERESNRYIGMLSKLLRFTLEMSTKESISLSTELDYLEAYMGLQKIRLNSKMNYTINVDPQLVEKNQNHMIPPMLIQPLLENAIIHGISPLKNNNGCIKLEIVKIKEYLKIRVEDNGIGIHASKNAKNKNDKLHKSYANQIMRERIAIFNYLKNKDIKFSIEQGIPEDPDRGTIALLEIPIL